MKTFKITTPNGFTTLIQGVSISPNYETGQWVIQSITGEVMAVLPKDCLIEYVGDTYTPNTLTHLYTGLSTVNS